MSCGSCSHYFIAMAFFPIHTLTILLSHRRLYGSHARAPLKAFIHFVIYFSVSWQFFFAVLYLRSSRASAKWFTFRKRKSKSDDGRSHWCVARKSTENGCVRQLKTFPSKFAFFRVWKVRARRRLARYTHCLQMVMRVSSMSNIHFGLQPNGLH